MGTGSTINLDAPYRLRLGARALFIMGVLALVGCRGGEYTPDAKFVDLYVELKLATVGYANDLDKVNETRRVILAQHHVTPAQFHDQYVALAAHPESWRKFQENVVQQVENFKTSHKVK